MEKYFTIVSDGSCDLPEEIVKDKEIGEVHFLVSFDGKEYKKEGVEIRLEDFYGKMVAESNVFPLTAAPSPNDYYEVFKEKAKEGKDILIGFNPKFFIDALRVIDEEEVSLYMVNPKAPCFIKDDEGKFIYLILPVNFNAATN